MGEVARRHPSWSPGSASHSNSLDAMGHRGVMGGSPPRQIEDNPVVPALGTIQCDAKAKVPPDEDEQWGVRDVPTPSRIRGGFMAWRLGGTRWCREFCLPEDARWKARDQPRIVRGRVHRIALCGQPSEVHGFVQQRWRRAQSRCPPAAVWTLPLAFTEYRGQRQGA
jgi:hypothetical protein